MLQTLGALASRRWLAERGLSPTSSNWYVEIELRPHSQQDGIELDIAIYPGEWGFVFRRLDKLSALRVTDEPFVHGRDDHGLLPQVHDLSHIGTVIARLERRYEFTFARAHAVIRSDLRMAQVAVRRWLATL